MTALAEPHTNVEPQPVQDGQGGAAMIVFEDVRKVYETNRVTALDGVSFVIEKGEFVFVVGASGSGKSTLVRLLLKEVEPTAGRIIVGGRDLGRLKRSKVPLLRRNLGCVFQDFKLLPNRTAAENVAYALKVQGESATSVRRKSGTFERLSRARSRPPTMMRPAVGSSSFRSRRMMVDLPEPEAPTTKTNSPLSITKDTSERACTFGS